MGIVTVVDLCAQMKDYNREPKPSKDKDVTEQRHQVDLEGNGGVSDKSITML